MRAWKRNYLMSSADNRFLTRTWTLCWLLLGLLALTGCGLSIGSSGPDDCSSVGFVFADDFSGEQDCGWVEYNRGGAVTAVENGQMTISTSQPGQIWWTNANQNLDDAVITVDASQISGPDNNAYGVICRYQNEENFYVFLISGDGYYTIGKYSSASPTVEYLTESGEYEFSEVIRRGNAQNEIQASCVGNQLSLTVNGTPLVTVSDSTFVTGDIGLAASTFEPGTTVVSFDNMRVSLP